MGRPALFNADLAAEVLSRLAEGRSLRSVCQDEEMPSISTVMKWLREDDAFSQQYACAREARADVMFEELDDVSEDAAGADSAVKVAGLRLKADNIKWKLARMAPKKYGEKIQTELSGEMTVRSATDLKDDELAAIATGRSR
jgi:hypothetical protein